MNDLSRNILLSNYLSHPYFSHLNAEMQISVEDLETFEKAYRTIKLYSKQLAKNDFLEIEQDCFLSVRRIFSRLQLEALDDFEREFLVELGSEVLRLLKEEVSSYRASSKLIHVDFLNSKIANQAVDLSTKKHFFGRISEEAVRKINQLGAPELKGFRDNVKRGRVTREDLTLSSGPVVEKIARVLNYEFGKSGAIDSISAYMGRHVTVVGVAFELSVPQAKWWGHDFVGFDRPPYTMYAHLDEALAAPKAIVYLSDVTEETGPTSCFPGIYELLNLGALQQLVGRVISIVGSRSGSILFSYYNRQGKKAVASENFRSHFMRLPGLIRFNSHFGWDVVPGSDLEQVMMHNEVKMLGKAGTFIGFDGANLVHRGGLMRSGERIVLQVVFGDAKMKSRIKNYVYGVLNR